MADEPDKSEKTEDASQKKLDDAHKKGDVAKSQEVTTWFMMLGTTMVFGLMAPTLSANLLQHLKGIVANADQISMTGSGFGEFWREMAQTVLMVTLAPLSLLAVFAIAANLVQHKPVWSFDPVTPKFSKISPIKGFQRLFSTDSLVNFAKGMFKLVVVATVMVAVMWPERDRLDTIITADPLSLLIVFQELGLKLLAATLIIVTVIALLDFLYQRHKWFERQKMTVKEVRDEYKQMEGDPKVKGRIRQIREERGRRRMMAEVPNANVIITNPTHYAVALKYDRSMPAPKCVAKGTDAVALKIREVGTEAEVPIVENPPLARALYASVDIDEVIPVEHFKAVAQVIGYVMRLKDRGSWRS
ncbi:flagellar biosynthesis protein FlhB [Cucumibacter marinus]|uniref:flagellar biosynthesis protein FlhB n=1 Tax=Cucumibacter marinus TaxID=1121252 RepID=UPI0004249A60|nr:flagellar biosynthesis protein FlhB [Cucumibacter marinus]